MLERWAAWRARHDDGLGYPRLAPYVRLMPRSLTTERTWLPAGIDDEAMRVDRAVAALPDVLRHVVETEYCSNITRVGDRACKCRCTLRTYHARLQRALHALEQFLERPSVAR